MATYHILYNPTSAAGKGFARAKQVTKYLPQVHVLFNDITTLNYEAFFKNADPTDCIILCGGDGTLSRFLNNTIDISYPQSIYYYATGTGNDFMNDLDKDIHSGPFCIDEYIQNLPICYVNGKKHCFINNVGLGIEGYACAVAEELRKKSKKANYALIAAKGLLLYAFSPIHATVTIDDVSYNYKHVWLASTMNGRFFGGGLKCAPSQDRLNKEGKVTFVVAHTRSRIRLIPVFLGIFKGTHIKYKKIVESFPCHRVHVRFDKPTALQIDGECILNVTEYQIEAGLRVKDNIKSAQTV